MSLVSVTSAGLDLLTETRQRKTAWLATRLAELSEDEIDRLTAALDVLEHLTTPNPPPDIEPETP